MDAREALHGVLSKLTPGPEAWRGAPAEREIPRILPVDVGADKKLSVSVQAVFPPSEMRKLEWPTRSTLRSGPTFEDAVKQRWSGGGNAGYESGGAAAAARRRRAGPGLPEQGWGGTSDGRPAPDPQGLARDPDPDRAAPAMRSCRRRRSARGSSATRRLAADAAATKCPGVSSALTRRSPSRNGGNRGRQGQAGDQGRCRAPALAAIIERAVAYGGAEVGVCLQEHAEMGQEEFASYALG